MYSNYEFLLLKRFLFSKKTEGYISVFSWFSVIGIMIGVATIIIVMSVMNGFRDELTSRLLGINGHINIYSSQNQIQIQSLNKIKTFDNKKFIYFPMIEVQALAINKDISRGVFIRSYRNTDLQNKMSIKDNIIKGEIYSNNSNEIIIGYALANKLNLGIGNKLKIAIPKSDRTVFGNIPRFKTLVISGIFDLGMYEYDSNFIFSDPNISRKLLLINDDTFTNIEVMVEDFSYIEKYQKIIDEFLLDVDKNLYSLSWKENNISLLNALNVEKNVMFLILVLIILVASMNIISGLIIFVKEKNKDIGILKTIGISQVSLIKIFVSIGFFIGLIGTTLGIFLGVIFSMNIKLIQKTLENFFNIDLFAKEIYYLSSLPSRIDYNEVFLVALVSLVISLLSTLFPAYRSSIIQPIQTIKNE